MQTYVQNNTIIPCSECTWASVTCWVLLHVLHISEANDDRGKRTSNWARTCELDSITEFQPRKPLISVVILHPHCPKGVNLSTVTDPFFPVAISLWAVESIQQTQYMQQILHTFELDVVSVHLPRILSPAVLLQKQHWCSVDLLDFPQIG